MDTRNTCYSPACKPGHRFHKWEPSGCVTMAGRIYFRSRCQRCRVSRIVDHGNMTKRARTARIYIPEAVAAMIRKEAIAKT